MGAEVVDFVIDEGTAVGLSCLLELFFLVVIAFFEGGDLLLML